MLSLLLSVVIGVKLHFSGSEVHRRDSCPVTCEPGGMMSYPLFNVTFEM